jgi:hypothetical protein
MDLKRPPAGKALIEAIGLLALLASWFLGKGGGFLLAAGGIWILGSEYWFRFFKGHSASPYPWMLLSPLLLCHYASVADFRIRLACFIMLIYILVLARRRGNESSRVSLNRFASWQIWLLSFLVFALTATALTSRGIHLSGDEPHYIMMAQSLVDDGDLDLKNNLDNKTYFKYLPVEIPLHGMVHDGKYRSFHLPGVSFLLVPFVYFFNLLGGWIPASLFFRLGAALINAFFALGLFQLMKALWPEKNNGTLFLFFLTTFPLVFHAVHLFPELPAATLLIYAYLYSRGQRQNFFAAGWLLAAIPWFHFKYVIPMIVLELFVLAGVWRSRVSHKDKTKNLAFFLIPQAISASLMAVYSKILYGSFNPTIISPEKNFFSIPLAPKIETLLSFFLDQRDGLLVYAPVFLMLLLVFKKEIRSKIRDFSLLAAIFLSYILFHAFTTVRGAYSPAARPTVFVLWIMVVFLNAYYQQAGEIGKTLFRFLAGLGYFATVWIFYYPLFLYQPVTRDVSQRASSLLLFWGSKAVGLTSVFPSFLKKPNAAYLPNWIWLALLAIGIMLYYARVSWRGVAGSTRFIFPVLGLPLLFFLCFVPHVQLQTRYSVAGLSFYNNSRNFTFHKELGSFKILAGQDYDLFFDLDGCAAERLDMRLLNPNRIAWQIKNGKRTLRAENHDEENRIPVSLRALSKFSLGTKNLVHLGLESKAGRGPGPVFFWLEFHR